jgi:hypothetical protein
MIVNKNMIAERKLLYGNNFPMISTLWNSYISTHKNEGEPLYPEDVAAMMVLMKVSRLLESPENEDTLTDLLNYSYIATNYAEYDEIGKKELTEKLDF